MTEKLLIGFDGERAALNKTGLGNYSRYILRVLSEHYPLYQYLVYTPFKKNDIDLNKLLQEFPNIDIKPFTVPKGRVFQSLWRVFGLHEQLKKDKIHLFHGLSNELPLYINRTNICSVVTIHDLIFLRYPHFYSRINRWLYTYKYHKACLNSQRIIAISESTKHDLIHFWHIDPLKIDVVYQNCNVAFSKPVLPEVLQKVKGKYNLPRDYILSVGTIEERKNLLLVVKALVQLPPEIHLVAVGKATKYTKRIKKYIRLFQLGNRVHFLHNVPFTDLPALYHQARVFVYPSLFEGFGIPIIEALHCGVPVIAAKGSCLEEAGGPSSIYVNPNNVDQLAIAIRDVLRSPTLKEKMRVSGLQYVKRFNNQAIADSLVNVYKKALIGYKRLQKEQA